MSTESVVNTPTRAIMSYSRVNGPVGTFSSPLLFVLTAAVYYLLTVSATSTISVNESPTLLRTNYSSPSAELTENKSLMVVQENYGHQKQEDLFIGFLAGYSHSKVMNLFDVDTKTELSWQREEEKPKIDNAI